MNALTIRLTSKRLARLLICMVALAANARAELKPGAKVLPYEIHNTATGENYCQMCAYSSRPATVAAYGKLQDQQFWADLEKLQKVQSEHNNLGFFGQVLDSTDSAAIQAEAKKHGITFPVVYAADPDWEKTYQVSGISRTIYYSSEFKIVWSTVGLDEKGLAAISEQIKKSSRS